MSRPSLLLASLALGLLGCQPDPSIGLTAGAETTTTGDPTASETTTTTDDTTTDPTTTTGEPTTSTTSTTEEPTTTTGDPPCNENLVCNTHEDLAGCLHDCGICEVDGICDPETETPHSCPEDCPATACNLDGVINALSEQCDDGEETATCNADCSLAQCGDGHLNQTAGEECDDGNLVDGDGCSSTCTIEERLVFVTSAQFAGDLNPGEAGISGLELADHHCQALADTAGHPGIFMAWLSDNDIGPATHFELPADFVARFVRTDGEVIADGWEDLTDGELKTEITRDEYGIEVTALVWSNTTAEGEPAELGSCHNWTSKSAFVSGGVGVAEDGIDDANWTQFDDAFCATAARLYCFQVG